MVTCSHLRLLSARSVARLNEDVLYIVREEDILKKKESKFVVNS